ncbi:MAG: PD-(D/E)XK nuclease family protein [Burkholderiaceae bacterium]
MKDKNQSADLNTPDRVDGQGHADAQGDVLASSTAQATLWQALWAQVTALMQHVQAHPARTVVLLPFFQLQTVARASARTHWPSGFAPRLETTQSWCQRVGQFVPNQWDIRFDVALDSLCASAWLQRAGLAAQASMLGNVLVQTAHQLGSVVAAVAPAQRNAWADQARANALPALDRLGSNPLMYEEAVARIALEWAVASRYATDVLFEPAQRSAMDALVIVPGLQGNPLAQALAAHWADISCCATWPDASTPSHVVLHKAEHGHDEADRAAACVLHHIAQGRVPVALAAVDRGTTRRISATLHLQGISLVDETGWKLSTTRAAASVMALLRAARWRAWGQGQDDALLDWLKNTSAHTAQVDALERLLRKPNTPKAILNKAQEAITFVAAVDCVETEEHVVAFDAGLAMQPPSSNPDTALAPVMSIEALLTSLRRPRAISAWLASLQSALQSSGQWAALLADSAGRDCMEALHILQADQLASYTQALSLAEFTAWVTECLENASFKPASAQPAEAAQVVVLPLAQVLARPFAAMVAAGADEQRLPASPEPQGSWTAAQRQALGLPSREALAQEQQRVWDCAMGVPRVDVLWRSAEGEQSLQPSPLLQRWALAQSAQGLPVKQGDDPRQPSQLAAHPTLAPLPTAGTLRVKSMSASSYGDLRTCPYRFFALRLLGLQDAPELDTEIDKRDFGSWLHSVLGEFHTRRKAMATVPNTSQDAALLDQCATDQRMMDSGFIPFAAAWPQVRDSYLTWLAQHEAEGWQFDQAELEAKRAHEGIELVGRLDRVDRLARGPMAGMAYVLDYKTESTQASKERVKNPLEDTQLAFYAALLGEDDIHAAYVNVAERECKITPQAEVMAARDALLDGITQDVARIHAGQAMPALGEGAACEYCAARGLCRKDMWAI